MYSSLYLKMCVLQQSVRAGYYLVPVENFVYCITSAIKQCFSISIGIAQLSESVL